MQAMINTTFNAVGGSGVYEGPEGEACIIEAITTISSKTKALISQEALTEKRFEEQQNSLKDMDQKIRDKIVSSDDVKHLIQSNIAGDRHNTQNFINM